MPPAHRSFADPYGEINDVHRKPRENSSLAKNPPKYTTALYSSTEQLQMTLGTFMFIRFDITMKSLFTPSLFDLSLSYLSISNPSLS